MARFTLPRDLYHGKGSLENLKNLKGKKAIVCVGGSAMKKFGFLDRAVNYLKETGMEVELFEGIEPDPSVETVMRGAEAMLKFEPDWIVAMGGGSPILNVLLRICARYSAYLNSERKLISVLSLQPRVQLLKLQRFQLLQITQRVSNIL